MRGSRETPHTWVEWASSQLLQNTPLHPIAEWGRLRFGADAARRTAPRRPREHAASGRPRPSRICAAARAAASTSRCPRSARRNSRPEELRRRQLAAMTAWVLAGARTQPVVLAFEDLHWADPTSLDLMRALADRGAQAPLLVFATTRPEFRPPWSMRSHHSVDLACAARSRAGRAHGRRDRRAAMRCPRRLIERRQRAHRRRAAVRRGGYAPACSSAASRAASQAIPPTLQQSLAARLDRLGPAREVAQIGAVLGRDFAYAAAARRCRGR